MYKNRRELYVQLESLRQSRVLVYVTGDRPQLETKIAAEVLDYLTHHLDAAGKVNRLSLYLYTRGGDTLASWSIVNLIRQFCEELEVIVPAKALSGGTLICLGANTIIMTKQATLGPIDPSVNTPLNPQVPGAPPQTRYPVSVEAINGFLEFAKASTMAPTDLKDIILRLTQDIHPLVLGEVFRARSQIRMLAKKLLSPRIADQGKVEAILQFLCSESGSHDYTINRREARNELGLPIESPDDNLYAVIKSIYDDIAVELELRQPYDPASALGDAEQKQYTYKRALIESVTGGSHAYVSEGVLSKQTIEVQPGLVQEAVRDQRRFEGWRHGDE